jgi:hypothetical protein
MAYQQADAIADLAILQTKVTNLTQRLVDQIAKNQVLKDKVTALQAQVDAGTPADFPGLKAAIKGVKDAMDGALAQPLPV